MILGPHRHPPAGTTLHEIALGLKSKGLTRLKLKRAASFFRGEEIGFVGFTQIVCPISAGSWISLEKIANPGVPSWQPSSWVHCAVFVRVRSLQGGLLWTAGAVCPVSVGLVQASSRRRTGL